MIAIDSQKGINQTMEQLKENVINALKKADEIPLDDMENFKKIFEIVDAKNTKLVNLILNWE